MGDIDRSTYVEFEFVDRVKGIIEDYKMIQNHRSLWFIACIYHIIQQKFQMNIINDMTLMKIYVRNIMIKRFLDLLNVMSLNVVQSLNPKLI